MSTFGTYQSLDVVRLPGPGAAAKAAGIAAAFPEIWDGVVLDVGCRGRELQQALLGLPVRYRGLDLHPPADIVADLEEAIPVPDNDADVVVALDVLEHLDGIHDAFSELCRVARRHIVISFPNAYVLEQRWRQLRGRVAGKYGLPEEPPSDRHRWHFPLSHARRFCRHRAELAGWTVVGEAVVVGPRRRRIERLVRAWPDLLSPTLVTHLVPTRGVRP
jgi:SAM-dependent methyltransferase